MQEIETHGRENKRKPSVEMDMHGGAKNRNWLFTRRMSELTGHQNALPLHGKCYFWNRQLTVGAPLNCGAADLMKMRSCGPQSFAELRTSEFADLRTCGAANLSGQKNSKFSKCQNQNSGIWVLSVVIPKLCLDICFRISLSFQ